MQLDTNIALNPALLSQTKAAPSVNMRKIDETAQEFEAMFLTEMLRPMFETVGVDKTFGGGRGEEIFRSFMLDEYGKQLASSGGMGIADMVKEQLIQMQADASQAALAQNVQGKTQDNAGADAAGPTTGETHV